MSRFQNHRFVVVVGCLTGAACGGKVVFDEPGSAGNGGAASTSTTGASASTSASGSTSSSASSGSGGCDAQSHTIAVADFGTTCNVAADCVPAFIGNLCGNCKCANASIALADQAKYESEVQAKSAGTPPGGCFCPVNHVTCEQGQCAIHVP